MMLSTYFNRDKGFYKYKNNSKNNIKNNGNENNNENIKVISSWEDIQNYLLPILPENGQLEFSKKIVSSLSLRKLYIPGMPVMPEDEDLTVPVFQPKKWARHASGLMILTIKGLSVIDTSSSLNDNNEDKNVDKNGIKNDDNINENFNYINENDNGNNSENNLLSIVSLLGIGNASNWLQLNNTATTHTQQLKNIGAQNSKTLGFLTKTVYYFQCFLELNEQWRIDLEQNNISKNIPWLPIAENVLLCEAIMNSLCAVESLLNILGNLDQDSVLSSDSTVRIK
jgi:hypothetical protein